MRRGQLLGEAGDSGNATGPHVDYMYWDPQGNLTDGTRQPGFVGAQVAVGAQGRPLAPGQSGQAGATPAGAPTMSQASLRQFLDTLPPPGQPGAGQAGADVRGRTSAAPVGNEAGIRAFLDTLPPARAGGASGPARAGRGGPGDARRGVRLRPG